MLDLPLLSLDELSHAPFWKDTPVDEFREQVKEFIDAHDEFIIDGSYRERLGKITWIAASDIVWLDYPLHTILWNLLVRSIGNIRNGTELWGKEDCGDLAASVFLSPFVVVKT